MKYLNEYSEDYLALAKQIDDETNQRIDETLKEIFQKTGIQNENTLRTLALPVTKVKLEGLEVEATLKQKDLKFHKKLNLGHTLKMAASTFLAGMSGIAVPFIIQDFIDGNIKSGILKSVLALGSLAFSFSHRQDYKKEEAFANANLKCLIEVEHNLSELENKKLDLKEEISMLEHN